MDRLLSERLVRLLQDHFRDNCTAQRCPYTNIWADLQLASMEKGASLFGLTAFAESWPRLATTAEVPGGDAAVGNNITKTTLRRLNTSYPERQRSH